MSFRPFNNEKKCERELIDEFQFEFEFRNDIGNEYFKGNKSKVISIIND
jgi:hypothetical protein